MLQWMDFDNLVDLADRLVSDRADKKLLRELMKAAKDDARGHDRSVNKHINEFQDELARLLQRNAISWADAARLAQLADELAP